MLGCRMWWGVWKGVDCQSPQLPLRRPTIVKRYACQVNEILERVLPPAFHSRLSYLSGPSFAAEVATGQPTAVTIAAKVGWSLLPCSLPFAPGQPVRPAQHPPPPPQCSGRGGRDICAVHAVHTQVPLLSHHRCGWYGRPISTSVQGGAG